MRDLTWWPQVSILLFCRISCTSSGAVSGSVLILRQGHVSVVMSNTKYQSESTESCKWLTATYGIIFGQNRSNRHSGWDEHQKLTSLAIKGCTNPGYYFRINVGHVVTGHHSQCRRHRYILLLSSCSQATGHQLVGY